MSGTTIDPWLREILRCPACRSQLRDQESDAGPELACTGESCGLVYRVEDGGAPVDLPDPVAPKGTPGYRARFRFIVQLTVRIRRPAGA